MFESNFMKDAKTNNLVITTQENSIHLDVSAYQEGRANLCLYIFNLSVSNIETLLTVLSKKRRELIEAQGLVLAEDAEALDS
jgi:predicted nuclease of predicted toxin-antitoxin system